MLWSTEYRTLTDKTYIKKMECWLGKAMVLEKKSRYSLSHLEVKLKPKIGAAQLE